MARILIIDDDHDFRSALAETVQSLGHEVEQAADGRAGLATLAQSQVDAVFLDHRMPDMTGLEMLRQATQRIGTMPPVIVLTAHVSASNTIDAMRLGAFDHLSKPVGRETVREVLARALSVADASHALAQSPVGEADEMIGVSAVMRDVHKRIGLAAAGDVPVLVLGETGTGKEMVARALHAHSVRATGPFVAINCAAIPAELLESELFGHVRGAFTGAVSDRPGCFRAAHGGVLLLDEIGDMAPLVQAKLLRVLQEGMVTPVGSHRAQAVDVRIVAATHRDLAAESREGRFREDLRYRLEVLTVALPPLRERLADIIPLAEHFLRRAAGEGPAKLLSSGPAQRLLRHDWPGNVRELQNVMRRTHVLTRHPVIDAADLVLAADAATAGIDDLPRAWLQGDLPGNVERLERRMIRHALIACGGNRAEAARQLGIHRQLLYRKLAQYGIE